MKLLKGLIIAVMIELFLIGLAVAVGPYINGARVNHEIREEAHSFLETAAHPPEVPSGDAVPEESTPREHTLLWEAMQEYNRTIWQNEQSELCNPQSYQQPSFNLADYGIPDKVFGVISIPKLSLEMPIYLGATGSHMAAGAAHLSQTSLPVGGENTNCVIAGHRGYSGALYFRYVPDLQPGDAVIITNLWETLHYTVTDVEIIQPNDVDAIRIQPGRDLVTLLTCHPYASGGKQRYLVFCERSEGGIVDVG